jgi:hypothetical protein
MKRTVNRSAKGRLGFFVYGSRREGSDSQRVVACNPSCGFANLEDGWCCQTQDSKAYCSTPEYLFVVVTFGINPSGSPSLLIPYALCTYSNIGYNLLPQDCTHLPVAVVQVRSTTLL